MTIVETSLGRVRGIPERKVLAFKGIPFAAPPTGERRYRPPEPAEPWTGERDCSQFGPMALQSAFELERFMGIEGMEQSEDCLTLNVWTPAADTARRPVMVWIHGGAFFSGSGSIPWYNGGGLARRGDVVVVTVNYRLGALGFLQLEHLLGDEFAGSGNLGLLDQVAALEWVRDNIEAFGGDPTQVTIFGESAGGMSVGSLLGTPLAEGLYHRAIAQSGACQAVSEVGHAEVVTAGVLDHLGLDASTAEEILRVPAEALHEAQNHVVQSMFEESIENARRGNLGMPFQPVHDGHVLPDHPLDAVRAGAAAAVPLLTGTTRHEMRLFTILSPRMTAADEAGLVDLCEIVFEDQGPGAGKEAFEAYRSRRPGLDPLGVFNDLLTDYVFRVPAVRLAEAHLAHQPQTYMYRFSFTANAFGLDLGAFHGVEILFCFDNVRMPGSEMMWSDRVEAAHRLGAVTSEAWLAFARAGDPNHPELPSWPAHDTEGRATMELDAQCAVIDDPDAEDRVLWEGVR